MEIERLIRSMELRLNHRSRAYELLAAGKKYEAIKAFYKHSMGDIERRGKGYGIDPYEFPFSNHFTPIEQDAWCSIRAYGVPLYPQYPAGRFFVDFGDPIQKIALECDGRAYHDKDKDMARDDELRELGWVVFRVTGSECVKDALPHFEELDCDLHNGDISDQEKVWEIRRWILESSDGVIRAIAWRYYRDIDSDKYADLFLESLQRHTSTEIC